MKERRSGAPRAMIEFELEGGEGPGPAITLSGISEEVLTSPEKIRQLMEVLELPKGTNAKVTVPLSTVIIR